VNDNEIFRAKALYNGSVNNHYLKAVVIENKTFLDFSPKFLNTNINI
jgi:hypothetical protein